MEARGWVYSKYGESLIDESKYASKGNWFLSFNESDRLRLLGESYESSGVGLSRAKGGFDTGIAFQGKMITNENNFNIGGSRYNETPILTDESGALNFNYFLRPQEAYRGGEFNPENNRVFSKSGVYVDLSKDELRQLVKEEVKNQSIQSEHTRTAISTGQQINNEINAW
jgi:hypothetical protein